MFWHGPEIGMLMQQPDVHGRGFPLVLLLSFSFHFAKHQECSRMIRCCVT